MYIIEIVQKEAPYFCVGFMNKSSIEDGVLHYTSSRENALIVSDKETMDLALKIISNNNKDRNKMYVMDWITEVGNKKRIFANDIIW